MDQPFTPDEQQRIVDAIRAAEQATSGEIRVHIEPTCEGGDPVKRAIAVFEQLGMHKTAEQNGVLFYLATQDRKFAVIGDKGIDARVPTGFWDDTKETMRGFFAAGDVVEGLSRGVGMAGQHLKAFFPRAADDRNELSDDISFG